MPLNEIPKYIRPETRSLIESALEQAWQELKSDDPADVALGRRKLAGTIVALTALARPIWPNLSDALCMLPERCLIVRWGTVRNVAFATMLLKRRTLPMQEKLSNIAEEYQRLSKNGFDAAVHSFAEVNKSFQALTDEMTGYSKKVFDDGCHAWEQLVGAKSFDRVFEIQSQYAKKAYDDHMAEVSKLGEMYVNLARNAYKPVEQAVTKQAP